MREDLNDAVILLGQIEELPRSERLETYRKVFMNNGLSQLQSENKLDHYLDYIHLLRDLGLTDELISSCAAYCGYFVSNDPDHFNEVFDQISNLLAQEDCEEGRLIIQTKKILFLIETGELKEAMEVGLKGLERAKKLQSKAALFEYYYVLSNLVAKKDTQEAIKYAEEALLHAPEDKIHKVYYVLGISNLLSEQYEESLKYYQQLEDYCIQHNNEYFLSFAYEGAMRNLSYLDKEIELISYYNKLIPLCEKIKLHQNIMFGHYVMGNLYYTRKEFAKAIPYFRKSLDYNIEHSLDKPAQQSLYELLYECRKNTGNYNLALEYYEQFIKQKSEMESVETQNKINELHTRFETEKKDVEIARLQKEKELLEVIAKQKKDLEKSFDEISEKNDKLEELNHIKDRLFAIIGHDLRKPALAFRGIAKKVTYLLNKKDFKTLERLGSGIEKDASSLNGLIDNLLNWALTQRTVMPYNPIETNIQKLADQAMEDLKSQAAEKKLEINNGIEENIAVLADENAMRTIFRNLLDNSIKYSHPEGVIRLDARKKKGDVIISIIDQGTGMTADQMQDLFTLSNKKSRKGTLGEGGAGLGMYLVHELVKLNNGAIQVESNPGVGTTFYVVLPCNIS